MSGKAVSPDVQTGKLQPDKPFFEIKDGALFLFIKAVPGSSKNEIADVREGRLRLRIAAAPEDGKANEALIAFFAQKLDCPKKALTITAGMKSRLKTVRLPLDLREKLEALV